MGFRVWGLSGYNSTYYLGYEGLRLRQGALEDFVYVKPLFFRQKIGFRVEGLGGIGVEFDIITIRV